MRREFQPMCHMKLKTPLMSISGYAEIIENNMVKPEDIPILRAESTVRRAG